MFLRAVFLRIAEEFANVLRRGVDLQMVRGGKDVAAVVIQRVDAGFDLVANVLNRARHRLLQVDCSVEAEFVPKRLLDMCGVHAGCERLEGVQDIDARLD